MDHIYEKYIYIKGWFWAAMRRSAALNQYHCESAHNLGVFQVWPYILEDLYAGRPIYAGDPVDPLVRIWGVERRREFGTLGPLAEIFARFHRLAETVPTSPKPETRAEKRRHEDSALRSAPQMPNQGSTGRWRRRVSWWMRCSRLRPGCASRAAGLKRSRSDLNSINSVLIRFNSP